MMIPKSVAVSTRFVALAAVMLIPAWGLAEESPNCTSDNRGACRIPISPDPLVCDAEDYWDCMRWSCVQRMREAMYMMDLALVRLREPGVIDRLDNLVIGKEQSKAWNQTMKDCVEGR